MGFLKRVIRDSIRKGVGDAIGKAVQQAVEPKATELANKAADSLERAAGQTEQTVRQTSGFEGALANLERSVQSYATEAAKNTKVCPACEAPATADKKFCPQCGTKLPEITVAEGAVCKNCGKQNSIGTKFCADCGTKLPAAIEEEQIAERKNAEVMATWDTLLGAYPQWNGGGKDFDITQYDGGFIRFAATLESSHAAQAAVAGYRRLLQENGFAPAGEYPSVEHLYKRVPDGAYHVDTEHCFDGDSDSPVIGFDRQLPYGGFDYVKPEPKTIRDVFDLFK